MSKLCEGCWKWKAFGKDCHFYWESKKECHQWQSHETSEPKRKSVNDEEFEKLLKLS